MSGEPVLLDGEIIPIVEFLEYQQTHTKIENPMTNEEIAQDDKRLSD